MAKWHALRATVVTIWRATFKPAAWRSVASYILSSLMFLGQYLRTTKACSLQRAIGHLATAAVTKFRLMRRGRYPHCIFDIDCLAAGVDVCCLSYLLTTEAMNPGWFSPGDESVVIIVWESGVGAEKSIFSFPIRSLTHGFIPHSNWSVI
jgi:hypothetical protein